MKMQEPTGTPLTRPGDGPAEVPPGFPRPEPTPRRARRTTAIAGFAAMGAAVGVGALALALVGGAPAAHTASDALAGEARNQVSEAGWTSPDGTTRITLDHGGGRGFGPGLRDADRFGGISITAVDGTRLALATDNGWTRTIETAGATITRRGEAIAVSDLKAGDEISFRETPNADGTYTVTAIQVIEPAVAGTVASVSGTSLTLTLRDGSAARVLLTASTTYEVGETAATSNAVVEGARILARGTRSADGTLTATSVVIAPATAIGTVKATAGTSFTVTLRDDSTVTVNVTSSTKLLVEGIDSPTLADVKAGAFVMASGTRNADGSLTASVVLSRAAGQPGGPNGGGWGHGGRGWNGGQRFGAPDVSPAPSSSPSGSGTNS